MRFKVANVISCFNSRSGGPPRTVALIARAGVGSWQADLFTTDYRESSTDELLLREFPGHVNVMASVSNSILGGLSMVTGVNRHFEAQLLRGVAPDVVHIHGIWSAYLAAFARCAELNGIPYIVTPHGMLEPWSLSVKTLRKKLAMKTYQGHILANASAIHATSPLEAEHLASLQLGKAPIHVVPNPVAEPASAAPRPADAANRVRVMLFLSRIHPKKGLDHLLQAWRDLRPADWRLLIVGDGEAHYCAHLRAYCATHHLDSVEFRGHTEGAAREALFAAASVLVLPTYSENFGNVITEALIRGLPVITTTGTPWSQILSVDCGWYVEPALPRIKEAIAHATNTGAELLRAMGERGRRYANAHFTLPAVRDPLLRMYQAVIH
jgi:glycosyltransferase involved in cell wall biosynthesis